MVFIFLIDEYKINMVNKNYICIEWFYYVIVYGIFLSSFVFEILRKKCYWFLGLEFKRNIFMIKYWILRCNFIKNIE